MRPCQKKKKKGRKREGGRGRIRNYCLRGTKSLQGKDAVAITTV